MNLGFTKNSISYWQSICLILVTTYILTDNVFINAQKAIAPTDRENVEFAQNTTKFAIDLLGAVVEENIDERKIFSSVSIQTCLGVIDLAVDLDTSIKLKKYLPTDKAIHGKNNRRFRIASKFFYNKGSPMLDFFKHGVTTYFNSTYDEIKIENNKDLKTHLSSWLKNEGTHSTETTLTVQSNGKRRFSFTTLMNFSNQWFHEFQIKNTNMVRFVTKTKKRFTSKNVPMMNIVENFYYEYFLDLKASVIELPFSDSETSMLILLPDRDNDVYKLQKQLTSNIIKKIRGSLFYRTVSVRLPKFSVDTTVHYTDTLSEMGLASIYCGEMHIFDNGEFLRVESIVQKNKFTINELGVNTPNIGTNRNDQTPDIEIPGPYVIPRFYADRPFIFFIQDREDYIFYAGKVTKFD